MILTPPKVEELRYKLDSILYKADFIRHAREKDPISLVYPYKNKLDQEAAGFIVSTLSYGRQEAFLPVLARILANMGNSPALFIANGSEADFSEVLIDFTKYRFNSKDDLLSLFQALKQMYSGGSSLEDVFTRNFSGDIRQAAQALVGTLLRGREASRGFSYLLPQPYNGSSCKRLNMFLRWMIRFDVIDLGLWSNIPRECLIVPLDTHISKVSLKLGLTTRTDNSWRTAEDITESLRCLSAVDPIKYDFALCTSSILKQTL